MNFQLFQKIEHLEILIFQSEPVCQPIINAVRNPNKLPDVAKRKVGIKLSDPVATSEPAITTTISLGDGGKRFSMYAKKKIVR